MKRSMLKLIFIGVIFTAGIVSATSVQDSLFRAGNEHYHNGQYEEALDTYHQVIDLGYESPALYYNMGNCHYKLSHIGQAILFFERAKRLSPNDEDVRANLSMANLLVVDRIEEAPRFWLVSLSESIVLFLSKSTLLGFLLGTYLLAAVFFIFFITARQSLLRSVSLRIGTVCLILSALFLGIWAGRLHMEKTHVDAVLMASEADAMSSPSPTSEVLFTLHEGTKVRLDQHVNGWVEIILPDRKVGWVKEDAVGRI